MWAEDRERRMKAGVPAGPGATAELPPVMALRNTASAKVSRLIDADSRGRASGDSMSIPCQFHVPHVVPDVRDRVIGELSGSTAKTVLSGFKPGSRGGG